jgi:hypothetical protein
MKPLVIDLALGAATFSCHLASDREEECDADEAIGGETRNLRDDS